MDKKNKWLIIGLWGILFFIFGLVENIPSLWAKSGKPSPQARLIQIEEQVSPDRLRIILKTSGSVSCHTLALTGPPRLVLDLNPCLQSKGKSFEIKDPSIAGVRVSQFKPKTVRIVFDFSQPPVFQISHKKGNPYQIFLDCPKIKPQLTQPVSKKSGEDYLPKTTIEEFKKEKEARKEKEQIDPKKKKYGFDFYMENLPNVLRTIGDVGGMNIVVSDEIKEKKVTSSLKDVTVDEAMNLILEVNNLRKFQRGEKTYLVTTYENAKKITDEETKARSDLAKAEQEELKAEEQRQKTGKILWVTRQFQIKNVDVKLVEDLIQGSIEKEKKITAGIQPGEKIQTETTRTLGTNVNIISVPHTNTLIAKGTERDLNYIEDLIKTIDQPISQVMIEARIVEASANFTRDLGVSWGGGASFGNALAPFGGTVRGTESVTGAGNNYAVNLPLQPTSTAFGGLGFSFASANLNIDVRIQAMEQQGKGKTISSPKVLTLDNKQATIKQGSSIPVTTRDPLGAYSTNYRDAALVLTVTPHISSNKKMRIELELSKDEPDFTHVDSLGNPTITTKQAKTEMMINDGDTIVIGGIIYKKETLSDNKIPGLGDIPILGWLFKTRYKTTSDTELLIFLTPKIQKSSLPERFGNDS